MPTGKRMAALLGGGSVGVLLVLGVAAVAMSTIQESSQPGAAPTIDSTVPTIEASMMTLVVNGYSIDQSRFSLPAGSPARISLEPPADTTIPGGVQCELTVISTATGASASSNGCQSGEAVVHIDSLDPRGYTAEVIVYSEASGTTTNTYTLLAS